MEYSYENAKAIDNSLTYAGIAGGIGFLLYLLGSFVSVKRYNSKLIKQEKKDYKQKEKRVKKQVEKNKKEIKKQEEIKEETFTQPIEKIEESEEDFGETRKIDRNAIDLAKEAVDEQEDEGEEIVLASPLREEASKASSKLEILGKLPKYKIGDLDV